MIWDAFISHAGEDTASAAAPLADSLSKKGLRVWIDRDELRPANVISSKINEGLQFSSHAVSIFSDVYLSKPFAKAEFDAIATRNMLQPGYMLTVLHNFPIRRLTKEFPLYASSIVLDTASGIDDVAARISEHVSADVFGEKTQGQRYFDKFELPSELPVRAIAAIKTLMQETTWPVLESKADLSKPTAWMGTDTPALIALLYDIYRPLAFYRNHSYALRRTFGQFGLADKQRLILLEAAFNALVNEMEVALCDPPIDYNPRTPAWRSKRRENPAKYWWQGITTERFDRAAKFFTDTSKDLALAGMETFASDYSSAYRGSPAAQMPLGLLANPLYDFTPRTRPVLWRVLLIWLICYTLVCKCELDCKMSMEDVDRVLNSCAGSFANADMFESNEAVLSGVRNYLTLFLLPRIEIYLRDFECAPKTVH